MEIVHAVNRGVENRKIFLDKQDYLRFIHDLFEFNDADSINNALYRFRKNNDVGGRYFDKKKARKLLVDLHAFCLMPNHYHLLLSPRIDNGIAKFMQKLNGGYVKYFNQKYKRTGTLFGSKYKKVGIEKDSHFIHILYYIHLNPLDLITPEWRKRKLKDHSEALKFLNSYRWSSHSDYAGRKNFPSVTQRKTFLDYFGSEKEYTEDIKSFLEDMGKEDLSESAFE